MSDCIICIINYILKIIVFFLTDDVWGQLRNCGPAANIIFSLEEEMCAAGFISQKNATLLALEKALMELAAYNVTEGIFYALTVQHSPDHHTIVRYIETGCYSGFMDQTFKGHLLSSHTNVDQDSLCMLNMYNKTDITERGVKLEERRQSISERRRNPGTLIFH